MTKDELREWETEVEDLIEGVEGNGWAAGGRTDKGDGERVGVPHYVLDAVDWIKCLEVLTRLAEHRLVNVEVEDDGTVWVVPDVPTEEDMLIDAQEASWEAATWQ